MTSYVVPEVRYVRVPLLDVQLEAELVIPPTPRGLVLFAHGSGSGRSSPRNRRVAQHMVDHGPFATCLVDLMIEDEEVADEATAQLRFDIPFLTQRLLGVATWLASDPSAGHLPLCLFGASTGAGAALRAAALAPERIAAVVSRGGRPDLAGDALERVRAPTLLIVGSEDRSVLALNERARERIAAPNALEIIAGATHLFEETGALDEVARLATRWFGRHLPELG